MNPGEANEKAVRGVALHGLRWFRPDYKPGRRLDSVVNENRMLFWSSVQEKNNPKLDEQTSGDAQTSGSESVRSCQNRLVAIGQFLHRRVRILVVPVPIRRNADGCRDVSFGACRPGQK